MSNDNTSLPTTFTLSDGRQIFMSYGMLNALSQRVGGPDQISLVYLDMELQMDLLCTLMGTYDKDAKKFTPASTATDISLSDAERMTHWLVEHLIDFFVRTLTQAKAMEEKYQPKLAPFKSTSTGSEG